MSVYVAYYVHGVCLCENQGFCFSHYLCVIQLDYCHENRFSIQIAAVNGDKFGFDEKPYSCRLHVKYLIVRDK